MTFSKTTVLLLLFAHQWCFLNAQCWNLVWEDEFSGSSLDVTKWEYQTGGDGFGNNELQYYTNGDNVMVSGGTLKITAQEDTGNAYPGNNYTSSRIRTRNRGDWRYGKMEARIKLPQGQGIWPAFWMMPTDNVYGNWPSSGEIDIMEYLGHETNITYGTCHYGNAYNDKGSLGNSTTLPSGVFPDAFHTFSIEWEPGEIRWYLDGSQFHSANSSHPDFQNHTWPFDQEFHFILNVAVGGQWPGAPDETTVFPQTMEVDWVRVYQQLSDTGITGINVVEPQTNGAVYSLPHVSGAAYALSFWAKANQAGKDINLAFINASNFEFYTGTTYNLTTSWENYTFVFTATETATALFNLDLGDETGIFCFDNFTFARAIFLPVAYADLWLNIEQNKEVNIHWITEQEENLDYFEVQRSNDALNWQPLQKMPAQGSTHHYSVSDRSPRSGNNYYRIKSVDQDSHTDFTGMLIAKINSPAIEIFPNPARASLSVKGEQMERIELYDLDGRLLKTIQVSPSENEAKVGLSDLKAGGYILKIVTTGGFEMREFIKVD